MTHQEFINLAIEYTKEAAVSGGYPFGALVVKEGEIVGRSNIPRPEFDPTAHAEITAIRDACKNLKTDSLSGCKIYCSCQPCGMCLGAIKWAGITEIYYGMDMEDARKIGHPEIFFDTLAKVNGHKIQTDAAYIKNWYDKLVKESK